MTLMMTGSLGLFYLSVGIKNITQAQSYCIKENLKGQQELGQILKKILDLNDTVLFFHKARITLEMSIMTLTALGLVKVIPYLKKKLDMVKKAQKVLLLKQKLLLGQSEMIKLQTFKRLSRQLRKINISKLKDVAFHKKALAIEKKKEGENAFTYKIMSNFKSHQKSQFVWSMRPFFPLFEKKGFFEMIKGQEYFKYYCTASLKQKGEEWISILYH